MPQPLQKLKILELGHVIAGPLAATLLADFGAEVIKIEAPGSGDMIRDLGPKAADGVGVWWKTLARNKRMMTLDWRGPEGRDVLRQLVERSDVLIENYRPGVLERAGAGPDVLLGWNPDLVILRISGYGQDGPMVRTPAFGRAAEAMSGMPHLTGFPDGPPMHAGFPVADTTTGLMGALGIMMALHARREGSVRGQVIDLAVFEPVMRLIDYHVPVVTGAKLSPRRNGLRQPLDFAPSGMFRTRDGVWVTTSAASPETAQRLLRAAGGDALADDPRFATMDGITAAMNEFFDAINAFVMAHDFDHVRDAFAKADGVAAPVLSVEEILTHPQIVHRGDIVSIAGEETCVVGPVPHMSETPGAVNWLGRAPGADTQAILAELGMDQTSIAGLVEQGVVRLTERPPEA